jgi:hypothetical protein
VIERIVRFYFRPFTDPLQRVLAVMLSIMIGCLTMGPGMDWVLGNSKPVWLVVLIMFAGLVGTIMPILPEFHSRNSTRH